MKQLAIGLAMCVCGGFLVSCVEHDWSMKSEPALQAHDEAAPPTIDEKTSGCTRHDGLLTVHLDERNGDIWLRLPPPADANGEIARMLWIESLRSGLGSNPVGLDRGQMGDPRVVRWRRLGGKIVLQQINLRYRAQSDDPAERRAVEESFATSILWAGEIEAEDPDGSTLINLTSFLLDDAHNVAQTMQQTGQGSFRLDQGRSAVDPENCLAFPDNIEFESLLTFVTDEPGGLVRSTAPTGQSVTLVQHHSFVRLPDDGYQPRRFDPRSSSFAVTFADYAAAIDQPLEQRWIARHRLEKTDPTAARSPVKEPIVYYVDRGAPEPIRSALVEGASWWAQAFEAAGFEDAFRVELLPEDANPLDVRYNVIQWVHRSTRGWSYGNSIIDPRTGEIIKGHVSLGSLRVRQDRLIFEGLAGVEKTGTGTADDPVELSLARIRQLAAHEVGHTLGFAHNFAASTYGGRASVMDYPAPLVTIDERGELDFSDVYDVGIGEWDKLAVRYAYSQFAPGADEASELNAIVRQGLDQGFLFLSDEDARPAGAAQPLANLWDNGTDPVAALELTMRVRGIALDRFGERNLREGQPVALLHEVLVPVYLHHRYQLEAAIKVIGGVDYRYAVLGDGQTPQIPIDAQWQRRALTQVLACLTPEALDIPGSVRNLIAPRPFGYEAHEELFDTSAAPVFDPLAAARTAAELEVMGLLNPDRCERLVIQHRDDPARPGLSEVLEALQLIAFGQLVPPGATEQMLQRVIEQTVVDGLMDLGLNQSATAIVRAQAESSLGSITANLVGVQVEDPAAQAHNDAIQAEIRRFLNRSMAGDWRPSRTPATPPGSPIGLDLPFGGCSLDNLGR